MGQWDIPVLVIGAAVAGYFVIQNPDIFSNLFPDGTTTEDGSTEEEGGEETDEENGGGGGGSDSECKKYCSNCYCKSYHDKCEGRGKSCSGCKGGNRTAKCGGSGGGAGGGGGSSSKSDDCKNYCNRGWCKSYRDRGCTGGCYTCSGISGRSCPEKVVSSNCAGDCKSTCWRSRVGSTIKQVCVDKSISSCSSSGCSACQSARTAFCKRYGVNGKCPSSSLAFAYDTYPHSFGRMTIA